MDTNERALAEQQGNLPEGDYQAALRLIVRNMEALRLADELSLAIMGRVGKDGTIYGLPGKQTAQLVAMTREYRKARGLDKEIAEVIGGRKEGL